MFLSSPVAVSNSWAKYNAYYVIAFAFLPRTYKRSNITTN